MTAALEGSEWSASRPSWTYNPGKDPVPIVQEAGRAPRPVWTGGKFRPHRNSIPDFQPVVSCYTDWATRPTIFLNKTSIFTAEFRKFLKVSNFLKIRPVRNEVLHVDSRTYKQTWQIFPQILVRARKTVLKRLILLIYVHTLAWNI